MTDPLQLPPGARLIHIGPHKTGTTALQVALHRNRESLLSQGAQYAGTTPQAYLAALGLTGKPGRRGGPKGTEQDWLDLVEEARAASDRRLAISSESFANAEPEHIHRLAQDLGPDRVHVVRMVRRYDKILPSQWQQSIAAGQRRGFARWYDDVLADPSHDFWERHGFDRLTRAWADVVGPQNVTVVVVDESDREWLLRVFERFLGLEPRTLTLARGGENRSLTLGEVELLRRFNIVMRREGWPPQVHFAYIRQAASPAMRRLPVDPEGGRIVLPPGAVSSLQEATRRDVDALRQLGVRIVGDLDLLDVPTETEGSAAASESPTLSTRSAAAAAAAAVDKGRGKPVRVDGAGPDPVAPWELPPAARPPRPRERLPDGSRVALHLPRGPVAAFLADSVDGLALTGDPETRLAEADHVVVALGPSWQACAGSWQEHLLLRGELSFEDWVDSERPAFTDPVPELVDRFGAERLVVVPVNGFDAPAAVRRLTHLTGHPLAVGYDGSRSLLAWSEGEVLRALNIEARERDWDAETWVRHIRDGVVRRILTREPARRGRVHPFARIRAELARVADQRMASLVAHRIRVVGDRSVLGPDLPAAGGGGEPRVTPAAAAFVLSGAVAASLDSAR